MHESVLANECAAFYVKITSSSIKQYVLWKKQFFSPLMVAPMMKTARKVKVDWMYPGYFTSTLCSFLVFSPSFAFFLSSSFFCNSSWCFSSSCARRLLQYSKFPQNNVSLNNFFSIFPPHLVISSNSGGITSLPPRPILFDSVCTPRPWESDCLKRTKKQNLFVRLFVLFCCGQHRSGPPCLP